jgi:hypothetical protein
MKIAGKVQGYLLIWQSPDDVDHEIKIAGTGELRIERSEPPRCYPLGNKIS